MMIEDDVIILNAWGVGILGLAIIISCLVCLFLGIVIGWLIK